MQLILLHGFLLNAHGLCAPRHFNLLIPMRNAQRPEIINNARNCMAFPVRDSVTSPMENLKRCLGSCSAGVGGNRVTCRFFSHTTVYPADLHPRSQTFFQSDRSSAAPQLVTPADSPRFRAVTCLFLIGSDHSSAFLGFWA